MLDAWNSGDHLAIEVFGEETSVTVLSVGDNQFDEGGACKKEGFPLNRAELDCLNWFLEQVDLSDYRREIAAYCSRMYAGTGRPSVTESDLEQEI